MYLTAPGQLELRAEPLEVAALGAREVLCESLVTAISPGTELGAFTGLPPLRPGVHYPRLLGYCNVARVLAAGADVHEVRPGQRVLSFASHRSHFVMRAEELLLVLEPQARAAEICCTYLFHLGYNAVLRSAVRPGSRVLVIGLGALGLTAVAMAAIAGARVLALSDQAALRTLGQQFGAELALPRADVAALQAALGPGLADVIITTSNTWSDWELALQLAGRRGTVAVLGFPGRGQPPGAFNPLDSRYFYDKQLRLEAVGSAPERADARGFLRYNERDNLNYLAGLIMQGRLPAAALAGGSYPGAAIAEAYRELLARQRSAVTYLLRWHEE